MKALGLFFLLGLVYGFEDNNQFIVRQANPRLHYPHIITQTNDHFQQLLSEQDLFLDKTQKKVVNFKNSVDNGFLSPQRVDVEETTMNSELVYAIIKGAIYQELENIFADDFEENNFNYLKKFLKQEYVPPPKYPLGFVDETIKVLKAMQEQNNK